MDQDAHLRPTNTAVQTKGSVIRFCSIFGVLGLMALGLGFRDIPNLGWKEVIAGSGFLLIALYYGLNKGQLVWELDQQGVTTPGTIIAVWRDSAALLVLELLGGGGSFNYWVAYEYLGVLQAKQSVKRKVYKRLKVGSTVPIRYLPGDPAASRIDFSAPY